MNWNEWHHLARNETLWRNKEEKGLLKAEHVKDYVLRLWFEDDCDVSIYELDFSPLVVAGNPGGVFLPLSTKERFRFVHGDYSLVWPNPDTGEYDEKAIDLAPECVRYYCEKYGKRVDSAARSATLETAESTKN